MTEPESRSGRVHPSWDEIKVSLESGDPSLHVIDGDPPVALFLDPGGPRVGLRTPLASGEPGALRALAEIDVRLVLLHGDRLLEISTGNRALFPFFYAFALALADRVQVDRVEVRAALADSLDRWRNLLRQATMLSEDQQTGLFGELWVLRRLFATLAGESLDAWTGPRGEAHDFRVGETEFEVKTTRAERRVHTISGLNQLVASPGHTLYLISLQFAAAGAVGGRSLAERVTIVRELLDPLGRAEEFDAIMHARYGLTEANRIQYRERVHLRSEPFLVPVSDNFPCLLEEDILAIPRPGMQRISDVRYRLDVSGLGFPDRSSEFLALLPDGASAGE